MTLAIFLSLLSDDYCEKVRRIASLIMMKTVLERIEFLQL